MGGCGLRMVVGRGDDGIVDVEYGGGVWDVAG